MQDDYYKEVGTYYDANSDQGFECKVQENGILNRMRESFRSFARASNPKQILEIGCGPGLDAMWASQTYPNAKVVAVDVSDKMVEVARLNTAELPNVSIEQANEHQLSDLSDGPYDLVIVFFGALNTVKDLNEAATRIVEVMNPGGKAVLTFVNKWYLRELLVNLVKLRFKTAFARLRKVWGGYSTHRFLSSTCYTPQQVRQAFSSLKEVDHRGYSITYPAWYNDHKVSTDPKKAERLWRLDDKLNKTPFWKFGEYLLFVFEKPSEK